MLNVLNTLSAIKQIYKYIKYDFGEDDFFAFSEQDYQKIPVQDRDQNWYCLNPNKLNKAHINEDGLFIVSEYEKNSMLRALKIINEYSAALPANATLQEKLLYTKKFLPF